ncbi:MAG: tetratricopeptide repeat protein [Opitutaceae bacterium]|nr:tetratricopeptide repeat protein [Opitutaceae bacterium]
MLPGATSIPVPVSASRNSPTLPESALASLCEAVRAGLAELLANTRSASPSAYEAFFALRQDCATAVAHLSKKQIRSAVAGDIRALLKSVRESGIHDLTTSASDLDLAGKLATEFQGGPGLLAAMLLTSAWQWPEAPTLSRVPDELWGDYTEWLFAPVQGFCAAGQAETFAAHTLRRLEDLVAWTDRNLGSKTVRLALDAYLNTASCIPLYFSEGSLRQHAELRGRLLTKAMNAHRDVYEPAPELRFGRKLKVGFVSRHFGPQTETYTTLPTFEQLDPERFEVHLFAHRITGEPLEKHAREHSQALTLLPEDLSGQLDMLRDARLDVIVFGTNVTAVFNEVARLALYRNAPLQVVNNSSCITSGLPHIDLYVSGDLTESPEAHAHFSERLGLLPGPAHAFNYEADRQAPSTQWTREALGVPSDALLFVTAANYFKIIPEVQAAWARLLKAVPGSQLLVHPFNPNWASSYPIDRFCIEFDKVLAAHEVDPTRLKVSTERFPSRSDVKSLLSVGDIYLDTYPFGGVNSLVDPLELGIPTIAWEGDCFRSRMGAALLRQIGLEELIATSEESYRDIAVRLSQDPGSRLTLRNAISQSIERVPPFLDPLAASDAFGALIETAFDQMAELGAAAFRADRTPLVAAERMPLDAQSRHRHGLALFASGRHPRAAAYLASAVQQDEGNAELWYDIARVYRAAGAPQSSIHALETSLRLDPSRVDSWLLLFELAEAAGSAELAREALGCALEIAPSDLRVIQLASRVNVA